MTLHPVQAAEQPEKEVWKATGTEPLGCPTPGACSCPASYSLARSPTRPKGSAALNRETTRGFAVINSQGYFEGIWKDRATAELWISKQKDKGEIVEMSALSALDAQGGEAVAAICHTTGPKMPIARLEWADHLTADDYERYRVELLYTHPSPAAVQALREALKEARTWLMDQHALASRIDAILKEQP